MDEEIKEIRKGLQRFEEALLEQTKSSREAQLEAKWVSDILQLVRRLSAALRHSLDEDDDE